jgi:hypothetical protein
MEAVVCLVAFAIIFAVAAVAAIVRVARHHHFTPFQGPNLWYFGRSRVGHHGHGRVGHHGFGRLWNYNPFRNHHPLHPARPVGGRFGLGVTFSI